MAYILKINREIEILKESMQLDTPDLPYILELQRESEVWEELGKKCLCCGSCSMVCPTCSCFNVFDTLNLDAKSGERIRHGTRAYLEIMLLLQVDLTLELKGRTE
jgi:ferredoxin